MFDPDRSRVNPGGLRPEIMSRFACAGPPARSIATAAVLAVVSARAFAQGPACPPIAGIDSVLVPGRVTIFGEMHGTRQSPAFVTNLLCHAAERHMRATLGLELPVESTPIMDRYVHSNGDSAARAALFADTIWHSGFQDGRTSEAMFALLDATRRLVVGGARLRVLPFSRPPINGVGQTRDSAMAATLADAIGRDRAGVFIVLTGNIHSQIAIGTGFDPAYRPMGYLLRSRVAPRRVLGLNVTYDSGTAWICTSASAGSCGTRALRGRAALGRDSIRLDAAEAKYDGLYGVGALVASPPALRESPGTSGSNDSSPPSALDRAVHDLCDERVALLGESPTHGFGKTMAFKAELVRRLVDECHYSALFFESGTYDFLNIERMLKAGQTVTPPMVAAAIGGLWANGDVAPLVPFLAERLRRGALVLGGLDDQLGRGTYAQNQMPADLVQSLGDGDRARCLRILQRHLLWQYTSQAPYGAKDQAAILGCLDEIKAKVVASHGFRDRDYRLAMIDNFRRTMLRDYDPDPRGGIDFDVQVFNQRDESMYGNFVWWRSRLPRGSRIIVWTANNHAAKDLSGVAGQQGRVSLGSYIHRDLKGDAFALGFSAYAGAYARVGQPVRQLEPAADSSLEARAFAISDTSTRYFDAARLRALGKTAARPLGTGFTAASWSDVFDGVVVFHDERPPQRT